MESYADLVRVGRMKTRAGMVIGWLCGAAIAATGAESDPDSTGTAERSGAGLLVIQETATPGARADGIRSFADAGYAVDTCEWTDRNHPGPVLGALARMRLQLADDAVLVVLVDHDVFRVVPPEERAGAAVYDTRGIWPDASRSTAAPAWSSRCRWASTAPGSCSPWSTTWSPWWRASAVPRKAN